jgi:hypothetical protein
MLDVREEPRGQERSDAQKAVAFIILGNWGQNPVSGRGDDKKSGVSDKKQAFPDKKMPFRHWRRAVRCSGQQNPLPLGDTPMIRRRLFIATAIIASFVLTACSDMTAPKNVCPMTNGSQTCVN